MTFDGASPDTRPDISVLVVQSKTIFVDDEEDGDEGSLPDLVPSSLEVPTSTTTPQGDQSLPSSSSGASGSAPTSIAYEIEATSSSHLGPHCHIQRRHPLEQIVADLLEHVTLSKFGLSHSYLYSAFVTFFKPKDVCHVLSDESWVNAMHEELENFERNKVWSLVEPPSGHNVNRNQVGLKNKQSEDGVVIRNKARLIAQGFIQIEGLDFNETFTL